MEAKDRWSYSDKRSTVFVVCVFLVAIVWVVFGRTLGHAFVNFDDGFIVTENPHVLGGLSLKGVVWAFTHFDSNFYTPLRTISHMFDCQIYGLHPRGHHLTNLLLHSASVVLLFIAL